MPSNNPFLRASVCALAFLALAGTASASTNLITNGSFESIAQPNGTWNIYNVLAGWQIGAKGVEIRNNVAGTAYDGKNFVELDTTANSWISQTIETKVGETYALSFLYSARPGVSAASNPIDAYLNGALFVNADADGTHSSANNWTPFSKTFVASGRFTTITFAATGVSDSYGGSLDKVAVSAVPEPTTAGMLLAGLGALGLIIRRRTR